MSALTPDTKALNFSRRSVGRIMSHVMLALLPGTLVIALTIEAGVLTNVLVAILSALCLEAALLHLRHRPIRPALGDGSIALAAWLLALCVPPSLPLWQLIVGVGVMTTLGKHLYGGLGHNPFNPAMVAYAVLLVSFPVTMTDWSVSQDVESVNAAQRQQADDWDAMTGATPLDRLREIRLPGGNTLTANTPVPASASANLSDTSVSVSDYQQVSTQLILHSPWFWVSIAWLCGGLYLLLIRVISWHIPIAVLASLAGLYAGYGLLASATALPILPALMSGAIMLGAFFIATDPVSAATSNRGKLVYGVGIGLFTFIIREFSSYPEGLAFAILLMNTCVPLIDYLFTGPKGS